jgi:hypothetical protein
VRGEAVGVQDYISLGDLLIWTLNIGQCSVSRNPPKSSSFYFRPVINSPLIHPLGCVIIINETNNKPFEGIKKLIITERSLVNFHLLRRKSPQIILK